MLGVASAILCRGGADNQIQSTTRMTDFFVVGKMSGILVMFIILVGHFNDSF